MDFQRQEPMLQYPFEDDDEDDLYDELRRQVLQLTAEDDGEDVYETKIMVEGRKQGRHPGVSSYPLCYPGWPRIKEDSAATPAWMVNLWRSGNGTGVFIPQGVQSRRRNRSRRKNGKERKNNEKAGRTNRQLEKMN